MAEIKTYGQHILTQTTEEVENALEAALKFLVNNTASEGQILAADDNKGVHFINNPLPSVDDNTITVDTENKISVNTETIATKDYVDQLITGALNTEY